MLVDRPARGRVLLVDDEEEVRTVVTRVLEREGYQVECAQTAAAARKALGRRAFDLLILDLVLPDADGLDLLTQLREESDLPVIVVSARASEGDRVLGLNSGADDYVVKPFSPRELAARVQAVLRRAGGGREERLDYGELVIDLTSREVSRRGESVTLTPREFDLLVALATRPRRACSRDELLHWAWGSSSEYQDEATVTEHMRRLRLKLEDDPSHPRHLVTVRGVGYRFDP